MRIILAVLMAILSAPAWGQWATEEVTQRFNRRFENIIIDCRNSRGGRGEVAAAYLTAVDLLQTYAFPGKITMLVAPREERLLNSLAEDDPLFWSRVHVTTLSELKSKKPFDLYMVVAEHAGYFGPLESAIELAPDAVKLVQTVLGNTEDEEARRHHTLIYNRYVTYKMSNAGVALDEAGIYRDPVATYLRNKSSLEIHDYLLTQVNNINDEFSRLVIGEILQRRMIQGSPRIGLVYGISLDQTKVQFQRYLRGILSTHSRRPTILFTPSSIDLSELPDTHVKKHVRIIRRMEDVPLEGVPGMIYIVKTATLPHSVFVALTALSMKSGVVPLGAGDGFMSAAINLGGPFAMTQIEWNKKNVQRVGQWLSEETTRTSPRYIRPRNLRIVADTFLDSQLQHAQELMMLTTEFAKYDHEVRELTHSVMEAAVGIAELPAPSSPEYLPYARNFSDQKLRESVESLVIAPPTERSTAPEKRKSGLSWFIESVQAQCQGMLTGK